MKLSQIIGSALVGTLLLGAGLYVCWWGISNHRSAGSTVASIAGSYVVASPGAGPRPEDDGRVLYLNGPVSVPEPLRDEATGLTLDAIVLAASVQELTPVRQTAGSNDARIVRSLEWQDGQVPGLEGSRRYPSVVRVGGFVIPDQLLDFLVQPQPVPCDDPRVHAPVLEDRAMDCRDDGWFYWPRTPGEADAGDVRYGLFAVAAEELSLVARQVDGALAPVEATNGDYLLLIEPGHVELTDLLAGVAEDEGDQATLVLAFGGTVGAVGLALLISAWRGSRRHVATRR